MAESLFVKQLVDDYVDNGLALSPESGVLTNVDGTGHVELVLGEDRNSLDVFIDGDHTENVSYDDENFAQTLNNAVHEELGI